MRVESVADRETGAYGAGRHPRADRHPLLRRATKINVETLDAASVVAAYHDL
jgi:hypothetical protein